VRTKLFAYAIHEELHAAAAWAHVDVKVLLVDEELAQLAEDAPASSLVKGAGADEADRTFDL
jgi:hypothetical protein